MAATGRRHGSIAPPTAEKKWYIVHTYSGHENKAKLTLLERVRNANLTEYFGDVLVPTESVVENVKGQRRTMTRKFFPGYMFVQMVLDDRTFHLVKNTPEDHRLPRRHQADAGAGARDSRASRPTSPRARLESPRPASCSRPASRSASIDGPFANFSATVEEVKDDKQKVKVSLSMFGRATSVELDFAQVEKA